MNKNQYTAETIKVRVIDTEKLSQVLNDHIGDSEKTYKTYNKLGIVTSPKIGLITDECVGTTRQPFSISLWAEWKENDHEVFECLPSIEAPMTLGDFSDYIKEEVSLKEFMGERYRYNSRICGNEQIWLDIFNGTEAIS
jgi:hypothetical protein